MRERPEDIRPLAQFFPQRLARKKNNPRLRFADDALVLMESYNWPGNVRELENTIQRATVPRAGCARHVCGTFPLGEVSTGRLPGDPPAVTTDAAVQHLLSAAADSGEPAIAWIERARRNRTGPMPVRIRAAAAAALGLKPAAFRKLLGPSPA